MNVSRRRNLHKHCHLQEPSQFLRWRLDRKYVKFMGIEKFTKLQAAENSNIGVGARGFGKYTVDSDRGDWLLN